MNNNQDNLNINPEINNFNNQNQANSRFFNSYNGFTGNQQIPLNVIPQSQPENLENNINQGFVEQPNNNIVNQNNPNNNNFLNNSINTSFDNINNEQYNNNHGFNNTLNNEITRDSMLNSDEMTAFQEHNKFITENKTNTALNDLNVEGEYNGLSKIDYSQDPKVMENLQSQNKKNTITITGEAKVFLIIIVVLLLFTFVMPIIFDFIRDIQY